MTTEIHALRRLKCPFMTIAWVSFVMSHYLAATGSGDFLAVCKNAGTGYQAEFDGRDAERHGVAAVEVHIGVVGGVEDVLLYGEVGEAIESVRFVPQ